MEQIPQIKKGNLVRITYDDNTLGRRIKNFFYVGRSNKMEQIYLMEGKEEIYMNFSEIIKIEDLKI